MLVAASVANILATLTLRKIALQLSATLFTQSKINIIHKPLGAWVTGNFRDAGSVPSTMASATLSEQITVRQSPIEQSHTAGFDVSKPP